MSKNINAVIVEDELKGLNNLKNLLSKYCKNVEVVGEATTIEEGFQLLNSKKDSVNVAFLDINLPDGLVFQMLNRLEEVNAVQFEIIFVTSYQHFAIKACQYSSIGYVLKPIDPDELQEAVSRIRVGKENHSGQRIGLFNEIMNSNKPNPFEKMSISALDGMYFVSIKDILRCEAEDNYTHIHMRNGEKLTASKTIKYYEEMLSDVNFYRVHKSHLVNLNYMRKFVKGDGGYLVMDDGKKIEVSRRRRPAFMEKLKMMQEEI